MSAHRTLQDLVPTAKAMTADAYCARYPYPFLFGREVLEEEFRFSTMVADPHSVPSRDQLHDQLRDDPPLRIRHWVIPVKKPADAPAQDRVFLGRSETNDLCVPHPTVSKLHGYFQRDVVAGAHKWFLVDANSANGSKHNGMRVPPRAKVALTDGDMVVFGRCVFQWLSTRSMYERILTSA
jgi:hypothetical protein